MTPEDIEAAVGRAIDAKLGQFYIDRETHYQDHKFVQGLRRWMDEATGTVVRTVTKVFAYSVIGFLILGFIVWGKERFGK